MWTNVQVNLAIVDARGWSGATSIQETMDSTRPMLDQCEQAAAAWEERQRRIFGATITVSGVLSAIYFDRGYCHVAGEQAGWDWCIY